MKILLVICDGMGDRPSKYFKGKTALQATKHKNLDLLAKNGSAGIMDTIAPGIRPGSDTAHLALLGHDPYKVYTGRGPFEATGIGMDLREGDVAVRCNFGTVKNGTIVDRRAGREAFGLDELGKALNVKIGDTEMLFKHAVGHRGALIIRGTGLSDKIGDTDPHEEGKQIKTSVALEPEAKKTAEVLNEYIKKAQEILAAHPMNKEREKRGFPLANAILTRGPGLAPKIEKFEKKYGIKGGCVTATGAIAGVTKYCGLDTKLVEGRGLASDLDKKTDMALDMLKEKEFCLLHIKGCDDYSHDGNGAAKAKMIGKIDAMIGKLVKKAPKDLIIAVTADHSTPLEFKNHTSDPVPLAIYGQTMRRDNTKRYDEIECAGGAIGRIRGQDLIKILLDLAGKTQLFGA